MLEDAESLVPQDQPLLPLYFYVTKHLVKAEFHGWYDNVFNLVYSKSLWISPQHESSNE